MTYRVLAIAIIAPLLIAGGFRQSYARDADKENSTAAIDLSAAPSGAYALDPGHGYIVFSYNHQGYSHPFVRWRKWNAILNWDAKKPESSSVTATIDVNSIDTNVEKLDEHLKSADFFEVEAYPKITFASTKLVRTGANAGRMTGNLTVKGVVKPVVLDVTLNNIGDGRKGSHKIGFSARGTLNRSDFGVDKYVPFVSDEVDVIIEAEFVSQPSE